MSIKSTVRRWLGVEDLLERMTTMSAAMDALTEEVAATRGVVASTVVAIDGLIARLDDAGTDPAKLTALRDDLAASRTSLAEAVARVPAPPAA